MARLDGYRIPTAILAALGLLLTGLPATAAPPANLTFPALDFKLPKAEVTTLPME